jgi:Cu/Ag efflux protein CusF
MLLTLAVVLVTGLSLYAEDEGKVKTVTGVVAKVDLEGKTITLKVRVSAAGADEKNVTFLLTDDTKIKRAGAMDNEKWVDMKMADLKEGMKAEVSCRPWKGDIEYVALEIKILE